LGSAGGGAQGGEQQPEVAIRRGVGAGADLSRRDQAAEQSAQVVGCHVVAYDADVPGAAARLRAADRAGVGIGTMYRHFPRRSDLVAAVMANEIDACADAAPVLAAHNPPAEAVAKWVQQFTELVGTKQGLAAALHSDDPSLDELSDHVRRSLEPALGALLDAARSAGAMRPDVSAKDVIFAVALLCQPVTGEEIGYNRRMVAVFLDGLRLGPGVGQTQP